MHMADALVSAPVGGAMWAASAGLAAWSAAKVREGLDERKVPLMGVLGAFIFAAQMINFSIPGTGSSGHLGGGLLLAILLGPHAGFLTLASVLAVQAVFFADGGLLAFGCNVFNLGFFPCFVAYPLIFRPIAGPSPSQGRILAGSLAAATAGLQLGAFFVVLETVASGISALPFGAFLALMQPIHLAIGLVEGAATAAVIGFVWRARPDAFAPHAECAPAKGGARQGAAALGLLAAAAVLGGVLSWFASSRPDGLEWAMERTSGTEEVAGMDGGVHAALARIQERTALLPDYDFAAPGNAGEGDASASGGGAGEGAPWPAVSGGTSLAGLVGGVLSLLAAGLAAALLKFAGRRSA